MRVTFGTTQNLAAASVVMTALWTGCGSAGQAVAAELEWELIESTCPGSTPTGSLDCTYTHRLKVPGGWLVRSTRLNLDMANLYVAPGYPGAQSGNYSTGGCAGVGVGLSFLQDPNHAWQP